MYKKWFGNVEQQMVSLVQIILKSELDALQMLHDRYKNTLAEIDSEIESLMGEVEALKKDLVVE